MEREGREQLADQRRQLRQDKARPLAETLHGWLLGERQKVPEGSVLAKTIDYSTQALGRSNWLLAGLLRSGQRGAALMTLIQSARLEWA